MLKFVPSLDPAHAHASEYKVFQILSESALEGYVFHSLLLAGHREKVVGEIDFVVVTAHGVLCLEVKGGEVVFDQGKWIKIDRFDRNFIGGEGPFKQVLGNMYALKDQLRKVLPGRSSIHEAVFGCGVMFPDIFFDDYTVEYDKRWIYDQRRTHQPIDTYLLGLYECWKKRAEECGHSVHVLSDSDMTFLCKKLRTDFYYKVKLPAVIESIQGQQVLLTEEQYEIYASVFDNDRVLIEGGAGTGKTMLAVEFFKREVAEGKRVLFLTFNKLLAIDLQHKLGDCLKASGSVVSCINAYYMACTQLQQPEDSGRVKAFYDDVLPMAFSSLEEKAVFDVLILDEAQDIIDTKHLMNLDELVVGGLSDGRWYLFYDAFQNLYNKEFGTGLELVKSYRPFVFKLMKNCRNTVEIAHYIETTAGISVGKVFPVRGQEVERTVVKSAEAAVDVVRNWVKHLKGQGLSMSDVVIVSSHRFENSVLSTGGKMPFQSICKFQTTKPENWHLVPPDTLRFTTVYAFKGLEADVVIMVDFDKAGASHRLDPEYMNMLRYTAISRGKALLYEVVVE